jgi:hypothetical protein
VDPIAAKKKVLDEVQSFAREGMAKGLKAKYAKPTDAPALEVSKVEVKPGAEGDLPPELAKAAGDEHGLPPELAGKDEAAPGEGGGLDGLEGLDPEMLKKLLALLVK